MVTYCPYCMHLASTGQFCPNCEAAPTSYHPASHHFPIGCTLHDRYLVGKVLGEGGFGITYLGLDTTLERRVAIKEYFPNAFVHRESSVSLDVTCYAGEKQILYEKGREQFLQEARVMARFEDFAEIVQVLDFFLENNTAYIVMELLTGDTLRTVLDQQGHIPSKYLFELMEPVLRTMNAVHGAGIIHRDISPDNFILLKNGQVKLLDFGCARDIDTEHTMTVMLKHGYAPTEQYTGYNQGPWTDIYALCATFYHCLTGQKPPRALKRMTDQDPLIPPNRLGAALTPDQERALMRGLAVEPKNRWQSMAGLYAALYNMVIEDFSWQPEEQDKEILSEPVLEPETVSEQEPELETELVSKPEMISEQEPELEPEPETEPVSVSVPEQDPMLFLSNMEPKPEWKPIPESELYPEKEIVPRPPVWNRKLWIIAAGCLVILTILGIGGLKHTKFSEESPAPVETAEQDKVKHQDGEEISNEPEQQNAEVKADKPEPTKETLALPIQDSSPISAGSVHTVGLRSDGTVVAVGTNDYDHDYGQRDVGQWTDIVAVSAGYFHTVGLKSDGTVIAVGDNDYSQCDVGQWTDIVAASAGLDYTIGLKSDGTVVAVGKNVVRQCDVENWTDIVAIFAGVEHTIGLKSDGTVVAVGYSGYGQLNVGMWTEIVSVSAGGLHTVGLKSDGTVVAVGNNDAGQCDVEQWTDIVAISAGRYHTVGLKSDGTVVAVGNNEFGQCDVGQWTDIVAVSAGEGHTVGLKSDGTVVAVGFNEDNQCDVSGWSDIRLPAPITSGQGGDGTDNKKLSLPVQDSSSISAGSTHTVSLKADGTVIAAGYNDVGQCNVGQWTDIVAISAGVSHTIGLKADGTVVAVGWNDDGQCNVEQWTDIVAISAGVSHTIGLKADGTVVAVGRNDEGQCDVGQWTDIVAISAGMFYSIGLKLDGTVVAVGFNDVKQCDVENWTDIVAISAGVSHTVGLKSDGTVVAVGENDVQCDVGNWTDIVAISAGWKRTIGLKSDGTVVAVGINNYGQCDVNNWTDIVAVFTGGFHTVGLKSDSAVVAVGFNDYGQCDVSSWSDIRMPSNNA